MIDYEKIASHEELSDWIEINTDTEDKAIRIKERYTVERKRWDDPRETSIILFDDEIVKLRDILNEAYQSEEGCGK